MKLRIRYETRYNYEVPVSLSTHVFRILPRSDHLTSVSRLKFATNATADVQFRRDLFDNSIIFCFYPDVATELRIGLEMEVAIGERNPFHFLIAPHATHFPFRYTPEEERALGPYLRRLSATTHLPFWDPKPQPTLDAVSSLNTAIYQNIRYERREEGAAREPKDTLSLGRGSCRDYAVLMAETLRGIGIAARVASGYLWEPDAGADRRAENALHAWVEAYLPGAGWLGMDPANGVFCNHYHIVTAVGISSEDVTPISGRYFSAHPVPATMTAQLDLSTVPE